MHIVRSICKNQIRIPSPDDDDMTTRDKLRREGQVCLRRWAGWPVKMNRMARAWLQRKIADDLVVEKQKYGFPLLPPSTAAAA